MPLFPRALPALRLSAHPTREDEINAFLSSDVHAELELEDSFASNMSLNSPPHARRPLRLPDSPEPRDYTPMDISPAPPRVFHAPPAPAAQAHTYARAKPDRGRDTNHTMQLPLPAAKTAAAPARPRSNTGSGSRLFGTDVSNANAAGTKADDKAAEKDKSSASASGSGRRLQRAALPFEWMASGKEESLRSSGTQVSILLAFSLPFMSTSLLPSSSFAYLSLPFRFLLQHTRLCVLCCDGAWADLCMSAIHGHALLPLNGRDGCRHVLQFAVFLRSRSQVPPLRRTYRHPLSCRRVRR